MADEKFIELIFEPEPKNAARYREGYQSLVQNPQQLFSLSLGKEISKIFTSDFGVYGKQLAGLLGEFFGTRSGYQSQSRKDFNQQLLEESLRTFLFSILTNDPLDIESEESIADIFMVVVKLSKSEEALKLLGAELGDAPWVLNRLVADGRIGSWSRSQPTPFANIISGDRTLETWAAAISSLALGCIDHFGASQGIMGHDRMRDLVRCFPCESCQVVSSKDTAGKEAPRQRNPNAHMLDPGLKTFESLLGDHLGPWKVILSSQALKDLKESFHSGNFRDIQEKLFALASGDWTPRSLRRPRTSDSRCRIPIYQASCKGNIILWQVDIAFDERYGQDFQIVKVWAICAYKEIESICNFIIQAQHAYSSARVAACGTIDLEVAEGIVYPVCVGYSMGQGFAADIGEEETSADIDEEAPPTAALKTMVENLPILGKFYSLTTIVLENIHPEASAAVFPVDVSGEEVHIINHFTTPAFILGRSGTGKTTCLIYKLASRYLGSKTDDEPPVRQLLLTRSKELAQRLKLYTKRLIDTRMGKIGVDPGGGEAGGTTWDDSEEDPTQSFLSLTENDFPLVCTFNYFLKLLENLIDANGQRKLRQIKNLGKDLPPVNFETFRIDYWRRFPAALTKKVSRDLAFIDIMGVIKGSASLSSNLEPLSHDAYISKRWKLAPNFTSVDERRIVYTLYENYESIKKKRGEVDNTDRVIRVLRALSKNPELQQTVGEFLDEVYVDEVQDQKPLEIELLLGLIRNPRAIHFAGDTAQCISEDSVFRFQNAKALFYTRFSSLSSVPEKKSFLVPALLPLSRNFRSHKEILSLASLVMELLYTGFPSLVDRLPRETGETSGPRPTLYIGAGLLDKLKGTEGPPNGDAEVNEFGEERVILVRDEMTRRELQKKVGDFALVLTILQSKGMEFENVFLYDFFTTSPYNLDFTVLEDLLDGCHSQDVDGGTGKPTRHIDCHILLCSELKHLYVGVTRARTWLWIVESSEDIICPVINLFKKAPMLFPEEYPEPLVEVLREYELEVWLPFCFEGSSDSAKTPELRKRFQSTNKTTRARWRELAYEFMTNKDYDQAGFCFRKAKDEDGKILADAYLAELGGMEYRASGFKKNFIIKFEKACELFLIVGRVTKAVECQIAIGNIMAAARIWSEGGKHQEAAWLYMEAGAPKEAAHEYHELGKYEKALATCFHAGLYDELAIYLAKDLSSKIGVNCWKQYLRLCYLLLIHEKIEPKLKVKIHSLLGSEAEQERTFRDFGMMDDVFNLYKKQKKYKEAYEVGVSIGFLEDAFQLVNDHGLLRSVSKPALAEVVNYVQAGHLLAQGFCSGGPKDHPLVHKPISVNLKDGSDIPLDCVWEALVTSLNDYSRSGKKPGRDNLSSEWMRGFHNLLVTTRAPGVVYIAPYLTAIPLEFVDGVVDILCAMTVEKIFPFSARMYLGIFEIPNQPWEYIALPWSSFFKVEVPRFPIYNLDATAAREEGSKLILSVVCGALSFLESGLRKCWIPRTSHGVFQGRSHGGSGKLKTAQFSSNLRALLSFNLLFLKLKTIPTTVSDLVDNFRSTMDLWWFWQGALIRQMTFVSSYEQDATIIVKAKQELTSTTPEFQRLYGHLQEFLLSEAWSISDSKDLYLSSFLQQMQVAAFLDVGDGCHIAMEALVNDKQLLELDLAFGVVALAQNLRAETNLADSPGHFCENVHLLLLKLEYIRNTTAQLSFYSLSVVSLYEELVTLLILLIRPICFVIPRSWASLNLPKWAKIYRSTSEREMRLYQSLLIKVVIAFCELMMHIEDMNPTNPRRTDTLVRRYLNILVISIINIGTSNPRPARYRSVWNQVQKVFRYKSLDIKALQNVPADRLLDNLVRSCNFYDGKDRIGVVVTDGYDHPTTFAGFPLARYGIAVVHMGIPEAQNRLPVLPDPVSEMERINSAFVITRFLRESVERLKRERAYLAELQWRAHLAELQRRAHLAQQWAHLVQQWAHLAQKREYLAPHQKPRVCLNSCILAEMGYSKDSMY